MEARRGMTKTVMGKGTETEINQTKDLKTKIKMVVGTNLMDVAGNKEITIKITKVETLIKTRSQRI